MRLSTFIVTCLLGATGGFQPVHFKIRGGTNVGRRTPLFRAEAPTSSTNESELSVPTLSKWDPINWTPKRLHNSPLFRSAAVLGALALAGYSSTKSPLAQLSTKATATVNMLSFGTWFGTVVYTTFVAGITMYKNLPRQTFGKLQAKLFPKYFSLCSITILLQVRVITFVHVVF